ncbi:hypothetical protein HanHA89_Chr03g0090021 [Helianthus annuus]|nr:hypothetical protein HanHA89_Chr03g0090021 [Helianthus annuus]
MNRNQIFNREGENWTNLAPPTDKIPNIRSHHTVTHEQKRCSADSISSSHNGLLTSPLKQFRLTRASVVAILPISALQTNILHFFGTHLDQLKTKLLL